MKNLVIKKSSELNSLANELFDAMSAIGKQTTFAKFAKKVSDKSYNNEYLGISEFANIGIKLAKKAEKLNKPLYLVQCTSSGLHMFFVKDFSEIKKCFKSEKVKCNIKLQMNTNLKHINSLDAAILAYLALVPKPLEDKSILNYLSKENLALGQCLLDMSGKYSAYVIRVANMYKEWAVYRKSVSPSRHNLNLANLAVGMKD